MVRQPRIVHSRITVCAHAFTYIYTLYDDRPTRNRTGPSARGARGLRALSGPRWMGNSTFAGRTGRTGACSPGSWLPGDLVPYWAGGALSGPQGLGSHGFGAHGAHGGLFARAGGGLDDVGHPERRRA